MNIEQEVQELKNENKELKNILIEMASVLYEMDRANHATYCKYSKNTFSKNRILKLQTKLKKL